jgi:hypothetical protein
MVNRMGPSNEMDGVLYVVGTPIGNLGDMSARERETLASVDFVAAEDTRRTGRLLQTSGSRRGWSRSSMPTKERTGELLRHLRQAFRRDGFGRGCNVSDPGYRVVTACIAEDRCPRVPGPSAVIAALVVSGLPTDRFTFEGFPSKKPGERMRHLQTLQHDPRTLVFFESPLQVRRRVALGWGGGLWGDKSTRRSCGRMLGALARLARADLRARSSWPWKNGRPDRRPSIRSSTRLASSSSTGCASAKRRAPSPNATGSPPTTYTACS